MAQLVYYDATTALERPEIADAVDFGLAPHFVVRQGFRAVRIDAHGMCGIAVDALDLSPCAPAASISFEQARAGILNGGAPPPLPKAGRTPVKRRLPRRLERLEPPHGAVLLKVGASGWNHSHLAALLDKRSDLRVVAVVRNPWEIDFPEYASPFVAQSAKAAWSELVRRADKIIALDDAVAARTISTRSGLFPSELVDFQASPFDPALAATPYLVLAGPLESRANTLMMLQIWRELVRMGGIVPKLALAGGRGAQVEEIQPLLDWGESFRSQIVELGPLSPGDLRQLLTHACALLRPDFAASDNALIRDAAALGVPVIASDIEVHRSLRIPEMVRLPPLAGRAWLRAICEASVAGPRGPDRDIALPHWRSLAGAIGDVLSEL